MADEMGLVVLQASLTAMASEIKTAHTAFTEQIDALVTRVNAATEAWDEQTASRAAEMDYQRRLRDGVDRLNGHLAALEAAITQVAADAHETEVENVALVS